MHCIIYAFVFVDVLEVMQENDVNSLYRKTLAQVPCNQLPEGVIRPEL